MQLTFTATDVGMGVASTAYSLDGGATWTPGNALVVAAPRDHSADGVHRILYRSTDSAGNVEHHRLVAHRHRHAGAHALGQPGDRDARPHGRRCATASPTRARAAPAPPCASPSATPTARPCDTPCCTTSPWTRGLSYSFVCRLAKGRYTYEVGARDAAGNAQTAPATTTLVVH